MFIDVKSKQKIRTQTKFLICLLTIILLFFYIHSFYVQNKKLDKINNYKQKVYAYLQLDSIEECLLISIPRRNFKTSPFLVDNQVSIPTIPGGWTINSLYYYKYLHSISIQNGHNLCLKCIDSNQFRISYWCTMDQDFPVIQKTLSTFFNDHYDPVFRSIDIKKVADYRQYISPNEYEGLVFFKVIKLNEKAK